MARIKIRGLKKQAKLLQARAQRLAKVAVKDPKLGTRIKNLLLKPIQKDGTLPDGSRVPSISVAWAKRRRRLAQFNKVSKFYRTFFSNLTFTGQFLRSFQVSISKTSDGVRYTIEPQGTHRGYKQVRGGRSKKVANSKIGEGQIAQGRDYRVISERNLDKIEKAITGRIRRELKLRLKNL